MRKDVFFSIKDDYYRIYTGYKVLRGLIISSKPVFLLPLNTDLEIIMKHIIECFNESREITKKEEDKFYLGKDLLKLLKEKSWKESYKAKVCNINLKDNQFSLVFSKYNPETNSSWGVKTFDIDIKSIDQLDISSIIKILEEL